MEWSKPVIIFAISAVVIGIAYYLYVYYYSPPAPEAVPQGSSSSSTSSEAKTEGYMMNESYMSRKGHEKYRANPGYEGFSSSLNYFSRPQFTSNLDPNNPNLRFDPHVYGGYLKGDQPEIQNLAATNTIQSAAFNTSCGKECKDTVNGEYNTAIDMRINDAAAYVDYSSLIGDNNRKEKELKGGSVTYEEPSSLLPVPDMRNPLLRDPSSPENYMYERTIFAPLKPRTRGEPDRFRGDLDIAPVKTGWFDIAATPSIDLSKGYFGYFNSIDEVQDLNDHLFSRARGNVDAQNYIDETVSRNVADMTTPKLVYDSPPPLNFGPVNNAQYGQENPWYNTNSGVANRTYEL
jgi:hypothetical protein